MGCSDHRVQELDAPGFHELLTHQDTAVQVEKIGIEPRGRDGAEYVVDLKDTPVRRVVHAEFPRPDDRPETRQDVWRHDRYAAGGAAATGRPWVGTGRWP